MKKKITFLLLIIFVAAVQTSAQGEKYRENEGINIRGRKEILIARDMGRGGEGFYTMKWCGSRGLVYRSKNSVVGLIDIHTKENMKLDLTLSDTILNCTPDGKRLLYIDAQSERYGEEIEEEKKTEFFPGVYGWLESTHDMSI